MTIRNIIFPSLILSTLATPAFAYIDPNGGGLALQLLTPLLAILGVGYSTLKRWAAGLARKGRISVRDVLGKTSRG